MTANRSYRPRAFLLHLIIWVLYALCTTLMYAYSSPHPSIVVYETVVSYLICASVFYANSDFFLPRYLGEKKKYIQYVLAAILLFRYNLLMRYLFVFEIDPKLLHLRDSVSDMPFSAFFVLCAWWWFQAILLSFGYWFAKASIKREREVRSSREETLNLRQEKLELENAFLRAQINPHFLFNTLGYFYNKVVGTHPDVATGIVALTNIMRSSIKKTAPDGLVPLEEEVENIEYLISIYKMRYNNGIYISFEKDMQSATLRILPHILITLVENAFKHGDLHDAANPLVIRLSATDEKIDFYIHNKKRVGPREISNGIGLQYVQLHLQNAYEGRHSLSVENKDFYYTLSLSIYPVSTFKPN